MYIGEIIKDYRTKNQLSQRAFASRTCLSPSYINTLEKIYNPKTGKPYSVTTDVATEIANAMHISIEELLNRLDKNQEFEINSDKADILGNSVVEIPILGTVKAGYNYMAEENWEGTIDLDKKIADTGEFFALRVKGNSMLPVFWDGDIVILKKQNDCRNNEVAVVIVNGNEGTLKKVSKLDNGSIKLMAFNRDINPGTGDPYYEDLTFTKEQIENTPILIVGVFQELRRTEIKF